MATLTRYFTDEYKWLHLVNFDEDGQPLHKTTLFTDTGVVSYQRGDPDDIFLDEEWQPLTFLEFEEKSIYFFEALGKKLGLKMITQTSYHATEEFVRTYDMLYRKIGDKQVMYRQKMGLEFLQRIAERLELPVTVTPNEELERYVAKYEERQCVAA